ncbi:nucleoside-diphosphate kinase [Caproiciproducens sp. CPB-2]|uniref:nucleoside-diphosphate kinase n=1 Tax=Caproiciproducens sp. CPB-2 TaxID=3030017 RepID=UPI0023DABC1C|nr:nucleoside-diphosphate kinase [Caproiciproducens sp. CPB-2]MDF1495576.1 nucleoside-diphosphate kinase [Caproiciproducens sp. CPB-2]
MERTCILLKPDALKRRLAGRIIARIEDKGYIIADARMLQLDEAVLREHYSHLADQSFFPDIVKYMVSGPVLAMIVEGENAVEGTRKIIGATRFEDAAAGTIRGDYAFSTRQNLIHGSDSAESAEIEIGRFFARR